MIGKTLRIVRIIVSVAVLGILTCGITCSALMLPVVGPWLAAIQLGSAIMSLSVLVFAVWLMLTIVFGRVYCSTVCPMGTFQDIAARLPRRRALARFGTMRTRYRYSRPATSLRNAALAITLLSLMAGFTLLPSVLEPFALFTRFCSSLFAPLARCVGSALVAAGVDSEAVAQMVTASVGATMVAAVLAVAVAVVAARSGRTVCNTLCPVGTALGCFSRFSLYQMDIDADLCINCGLCADVCKASCVDLTDHVVDGSRCVVCFDCMAVCPAGAMRYTRRRKQLATPLMQKTVGLGRRPEASMDSSKTIKSIGINETISDTAPRHSRPRH